MKVINVRNVNTALYIGMRYLISEGQIEQSRNGEVRVAPVPVTTVYEKPLERVLFNKSRDANPFFHLFESLWMLAGRRDVGFLSLFNSNMVNYSDDGEVFNAAYGYRMRTHFHIDQLLIVIHILKTDPTSRQAVIQLWDEYDLGKQTKDKACNMSLVFSVRNRALDLTVYNRSNDMIWGAYGANVVHMSFFQEYVAAHLGLPMGKYYQVSNNFHAYTEGRPGELFNKLKTTMEPPLKFNYDNLEIIGIDSDLLSDFDDDLNTLFEIFDSTGVEFFFKEFTKYQHVFEHAFFNDLVVPMMEKYIAYKTKGDTTSVTGTLTYTDWGLAANIWLANREESKKAKQL